MLKKATRVAVLMSVVIMTIAVTRSQASSPIEFTVDDPEWTLTDVINFDAPSGVEVSPVDGLLYVVRVNRNFEDGGVYRIENDGAATFMGPADRAVGLAIDLDGDMFYAENWGRSGATGPGGNVYRIPYGGAASETEWVTNLGNDNLDDDPLGLYIVPDDYIAPAGSKVAAGDGLIVDHGFNGYERIFLWDPDVAINDPVALVDDSDMAGNVGSILGLPMGITCAGSSFYIMDKSFENSILVLDPVSGNISGLATSRPLPTAQTIITDPNSGDLFVTARSSDSSDDSSVFRVDRNTGEVSVIAHGLVYPIKADTMAFSADGSKLYVADNIGDKVYVISQVPEPSTLVLLLLGSITLLGFRRFASH